MKTIEVDPRVPGIRDEIPFPQAKQCSPELDFPSCQFSFPSVRNYSVCRKNLIVTVETYRHNMEGSLLSHFVSFLSPFCCDFLSFSLFRWVFLCFVASIFSFCCVVLCSVLLRFLVFCSVPWHFVVLFYYVLLCFILFCCGLSLSFAVFCSVAFCCVLLCSVAFSRLLPNRSPAAWGTSAPESLYGGQFTLSTQLIKPNYLTILPLTQHHSFFGNFPPFRGFVVFYCVLLRFVVFCSVLLHFVVFYCVLLCFVVFCSVLLHFVVFYSVLLCFVVFCSVLCYILLCCVLAFCFVLFSCLVVS